MDTPASQELALVYVRQAAGPATGLAGATRQRHECEELCRRQGWPIAAVVDDSGQPGRGPETPQRLTMLAQALDEHRCTLLVITDLDRIARDAGAVANFVQAIRASVRLVTVERGVMSSLEVASILFWADEQSMGEHHTAAPR